MKSLDLAAPQVLGTAIADGRGNATFANFVSDSSRGFTFLHQAFEPAAAKVSDVRVVRH